MSDAAVASLIAAVGVVLAATIPALVNVSRRTKQMYSELTPNGGASVKDAVDRIEHRVGRIEAWNDQHELRDTVFEEYVHREMRKITTKFASVTGDVETRAEWAEAAADDLEGRTHPPGTT